MIDPNTLVMVEWYTNQHIPRQHHAVIVTYAQAENWMRMGMRITATEIWEDILHERKSSTW